MEKGEIARDEQFLLFPQCFLPFWRTFCHLYEIQNCRLQTLSIWTSLKFVVWEMVKNDNCCVKIVRPIFIVKWLKTKWLRLAAFYSSVYYYIVFIHVHHNPKIYPFQRHGKNHSLLRTTYAVRWLN